MAHRCRIRVDCVCSAGGIVRPHWASVHVFLVLGIAIVSLADLRARSMREDHAASGTDALLAQPLHLGAAARSARRAREGRKGRGIRPKERSAVSCEAKFRPEKKLLPTRPERCGSSSPLRRSSRARWPRRRTLASGPTRPPATRGISPRPIRRRTIPRRRTQVRILATGRARPPCAAADSRACLADLDALRQGVLLFPALPGHAGLLEGTRPERPVEFASLPEGPPP